ncbi:MAG: NAD-dependent epimerase/dehydratase family protein [Kiloniellales bacterium]
MKIVVTGALGHIGSRLIRVLPEVLPDLELVLIDDLSAQRYASLFDLPASARYRFVEGDVTAMDLKPLLADAWAVVHLAAITDATGSFDNREAVERNNFGATQRVAEACAEAGARLVHLSSTSVYGSQAAKVDETCAENELRPQSPYAETKLREERLVLDMAQRGLWAVSCRFGTIFGTSTGMRFHTAVNKFCWQAVMGLPLTVWRTAYEQRRPYLDLQDAVRAVAHFLRQDLFDGRIYNVVTQNATVREVVDHIRAHVPDLKVEFVDTRIMNQLSFDVENARMTAAGFRFEGDLGRGIAETVALLRQANAR